MKTNPLIIYPLWILVIFGFISVAKVSIEHFVGASCPTLFSIPVCYVVTLAYAAMLAALTIKNGKLKHHFFCSGWSVAFVIALLASIAEMFSGGGICPSSSGGLRGTGSAVSGVPLCYISLGLLVVILILFVQGPYKKACELHNN